MYPSNSGFRRFHFKQNKGLPAPGAMPPRYSGGGVANGQYQMYNNTSGDGGGNGTWIDGKWYSSGNTPNSGQGPTGSQTNSDPDIEPTPIPSNGPDSPSTSAGGGGPSNYPGGLQLQNDLGYNPSYPYGSMGSGVPTQTGAGMLGGGLGAGLGTLIFPFGGGALGGKLGAMGGRMFARWLQSQQSKQPGSGSGEPMPSGSVDIGGGQPQGGSYNPFGGLPSGFSESGRDYQGGPNEFSQTGGAPNFQYGSTPPPMPTGGSFFGGSGSPTVPGSGFLNNAAGEGSLPMLGGGHSDYSADIALHGGKFLNAIQGMGYNNLSQFQKQTGFKLPGQVGGGQGVAGAEMPMKQNFAGGGVAGDDDDPYKNYGTTFVDINGQRTEVPLWNKDMTPDQAEEAARMRMEWNLSPFAADSELEKAQNISHKGPDDASAQEQDTPEHEAWANSLVQTPEDAAKLYRVMSLQKNDDQNRNFSTGRVGNDQPSTDVTTPEEMAERYEMFMRQREQKRKEAMNESPATDNSIEPQYDDLAQQISAQPQGKTSMGFWGGGTVPTVPPQQQLQGMGTDSVPAALTPGELILNKGQQSAVEVRPGMGRKLKPEQRAAIEIALRNKRPNVSTIPRVG